MKAFINMALRSLMVTPVLALAFSFAVPLTASAVAPGTPINTGTGCDANNLSITSGADCARGNDQQGDLFAENGLFRTITNILLFLVGAIAVIMLIIGGIRYVVSGGDQSAVTSAKNTILYAIVGIIVALLAYGIVNFVLTQLTANNP